MQIEGLIYYRLDAPDLPYHGCIIVTNTDSDKAEIERKLSEKGYACSLVLISPSEVSVAFKREQQRREVEYFAKAMPTIEPPIRLSEPKSNKRSWNRKGIVGEKSQYC